MSTHDVPEFDFHYWSELAAKDPELFEELRRSVIDALIASAPEHQQRRLRGLQWRVDRVRERAGNPVSSCVRVSEMMWDSVAGDNGLLEALATLADARGRPLQDKRSATIVPLRQPDEEPES